MPSPWTPASSCSTSRTRRSPRTNPTSSFAAMHDLAARGRVVILVSHRLGEMVAHCDRVAVIRDGVVAAELAGAEPDRGRHRTRAGARATRPSVEGRGRIRRRPDATPEGLAPTSTGDVGRGPGRESGWSSDRAAASGTSIAPVRPRRGRRLRRRRGFRRSGARRLVRGLRGRRTAICCSMASRASTVVDDRTVYLPADRRGMLFANLSVGENLVMRLGGREIGTPGGLPQPPPPAAARRTGSSRASTSAPSRIERAAAHRCRAATSRRSPSRLRSRGDRRCWCSRSRPAGSMSAARRKSTASCATTQTQGNGVLVVLHRGARGLRAGRPGHRRRCRPRRARPWTSPPSRTSRRLPMPSPGSSTPLSRPEDLRSRVPWPPTAAAQDGADP